MSTWMLRLHDTRQRPLGRGDVKAHVVARLSQYELVLVTGPTVIFDLRGTRPGEWAFRIEDELSRPEALVRTLLDEALSGLMLRRTALHVAETVVNKPRHLHAVPAPPKKIPRRSPNSPYAMIDAPLPYTGDTR